MAVQSAAGAKRNTDAALPVDDLVMRVQEQAACTEALAVKAVHALGPFLDACAESAEPLSPPPLVDAAWHAFILDTEAYARFCEARYGCFIHHRPMPPSPSGYSRGRELAALAIDLDPEIWPAAQVADCRGSCGGQKIGQ